jgi:predicted dehydrogenase
MKQISVIILGGGNRGSAYSKHMVSLPEQYKIVGMADPDPARREKFQKNCGIPAENCYASWEEILEQPKMADVCMITMVDNMHYYPALKAIEKGYNLLLEKPVAQTAQECADIALAAQKKGVSVLVCHVLRYTPFFNRVKELIMDGTLGDIVSVIHVEAVGNVHQSHSYVRGNWHSEEESTPMLLAKSCHDLDILQWLLDKPCKKIQSFGSLTHFTAENAPEGAPVRCADGGCPVADSCPYNCVKLYYDDKKNNWFRGTATKNIAKGEIATDEEVLQALKTTDYGLCVYHANNDVVDHQVVNMEFEGGITVSFSMNCFNKGGRYIRIFGTKGELMADMKESTITFYSFADKQNHDIPVSKQEESILGGHGGGDVGIVKELYEYLSGSYTGYRAADIVTSVKNHFLGFAAEKSRRNGTVESIDEFMASYGFKNEY